MQIGHLKLRNSLIAAPMAGISDKPFRQLCCQFGAAMAISEMLSSNPQMWRTDKSLLRRIHPDEKGIRAVQIVGNDPVEMAAAAKMNVAFGAQLIDINMGCPAKKINRKLAGSALLQFPALIEQILCAVVEAVKVPVTLKIRTGWSIEHRNAIYIAQLAEQCGIQALTIHGRTRACLFNGAAEYDTIRQVKRLITIPVIANGDITSAEKARIILDYTGADGLMIGRAAQGKPWIFQEIQHYLETGEQLPKKSTVWVKQCIIEHVQALHQFYGLVKGVRIARKHIAWYLQQYPLNDQFKRAFNAIDDAHQQLDALSVYFKNFDN